MPLTGLVDFGVTINPPIPCGAFAMIATDGTRHALARVDNDVNTVAIACAETNTAAFTLSVAQFKTDLATRGISGVGQLEPYLAHRIAVPGSPFFIVMGSRLDGFGGFGDVFGLRYRIDAPGTVEIDGLYHYDCDPLGFIATGVWGGPVGQQKIGDDIYYVQDLGESFSGFRQQLIKLPLAGDDVDLTANSWATKRQDLPSPMDDILWWQGIAGVGLSSNLAALYEDEAGIGIIVYDRSVTPAQAYQTVIHTAGTNTGFNDVSATFNLPFADEMTLDDGSPSTNERDNFTSPSINETALGSEVIFTRGISDNRQWVICERFLMNGIDSVQYLGRFEFQLTDEVVSTEVEAIWLYRDGDELLAMMRDNARFIFGFTSLPLSGGECQSSGFDLRYPPCVTRWTQCVRIVRRDGMTFRFTTLDRDFEFRGETYLSCNSLNASATQTLAGLGEAGSSELRGIIATTAVDEAELYGGLFDDAFVEIWLVPYEGGDKPRRLAAGWSGKITHSVRGYQMEVLGPGARLDQKPIVQLYSPQCRWVFGDERCGVNLDALAIPGTVTSGLNRGIFLATVGPAVSTGTGAAESSGELTNQFANGTVRWLTGVNAGQVTEVKDVDFETGQVVLWALTCFVPEAGDTFDLMPGCAQDFETCGDLYDNADAFGGFPHVPGTDAIIQTPDAKN